MEQDSPLSRSRAEPAENAERLPLALNAGAAPASPRNWPRLPQNADGASPHVSASSAFLGVDFPPSSPRSFLRASAPPRQTQGLSGTGMPRLRSGSRGHSLPQQVLQRPTQFRKTKLEPDRKSTRLNSSH